MHDADIGLSADGVLDEREYWTARKEQLGRISQIVSDFIEKGEYSGDIIVCNPKDVITSSLFGTALCNSYQQLLRYCDGLRVNNLVVLGSVPKKNRLIEEKGDKYLTIGEDLNHWYAYLLKEGKMNNEVIEFPRQSGPPQKSGVTVIELLENALI